MTSKKYDIFGIGGAIFDLEYHVEDSFFEEVSLQKGVRTLVTDAEQTHIINMLHNKGYKPTLSEGGGSAANSLTCARAFGSEVYFCCKVVSDYSGSIYLADMESKQIHMNENNMYEADPSHCTGRCLALVSNDAERTMATSLGVSNDFSIEDIDLEAVKQSKYMMIEGYLLEAEHSRKVCDYLQLKAQEYGVKIVLTLSDPVLVQKNRDHFLALLEKGIDIIVGNADEALALTNTDTHSAAVMSMMQYNAAYAITLGPDGVAIFNGDSVHFIKAKSCKCVDTLGAGDCFAGAFIHGLSEGKRWSESANLANICASKIVSREGPRIKQHEADTIQSKFAGITA